MSINKCYDTWLSCLSLKAKQKYIADQKKYGKFFALILGPLYKEDKNSNKVQSQFIFGLSVRWHICNLAYCYLAYCYLAYCQLASVIWHTVNWHLLFGIRVYLGSICILYHYCSINGDFLTENA